MSLVDVKEVDRRFYEERIREFLPRRIIDIHTHVWLKKFKAEKAAGPKRSVVWPSRVADENPVENLVESYRLMLPENLVMPLMFGNTLDRDDDIEGGNAYVSGAAADHAFPSLIFAAPYWTGEDLEKKIIDGCFVGAKVYLTLSDPAISEKDISIFDFLPHHQLEVFDRRGWIVVLHIPRSGRLRDPLNLSQLREIEQKYPRVQVVVAHAGRAYCNEDAGGAFEILAKTRNLKFDISANTNPEIFKRLIDAVGPGRILFGSDMPITRMRMSRICERGNYVNIVPRGLYGDVSGDVHMREAEGEEADRLTFFLYEEIYAFLLAAESAGLDRKSVDDVFFNNAERMLKTSGWSAGKRTKQ